MPSIEIIYNLYQNHKLFTLVAVLTHLWANEGKNYFSLTSNHASWYNMENASIFLLTLNLMLMVINITLIQDEKTVFI